MIKKNKNKNLSFQNKRHNAQSYYTYFLATAARHSQNFEKTYFLESILCNCNPL